MEKIKLQPLTEMEKRMAEENHNLVYSFLHRHGYSIEEFYNVVRKIYSEDTRKLIYLNAHGRCELCGRKILLEDMTVDHINPLSMGGEDDVENLACTCYPFFVMYSY